jgi:hypothetical protein
MSRSERPCKPQATEDGFTKIGERCSRRNKKTQWNTNEASSQALCVLLPRLGIWNIFGFGSEVHFNPEASAGPARLANERANETPTVPI